MLSSLSPERRQQLALNRTDLTDVTTTLAYEDLGKTVNILARFSMSPARGLSHTVALGL